MSVGVDDLTEFFSKFGAVTEAQVMYDSNTGRSRGFGFVSFGKLYWEFESLS
jgi:RNA-binding protein Musashi